MKCWFFIGQWSGDLVIHTTVVKSTVSPPIVQITEKPLDKISLSSGKPNYGQSFLQILGNYGILNLEVQQMRHSRYEQTWQKGQVTVPEVSVHFC